ncbi:Nudix family hydrolase [Gilvimarinus xylanilyticus]|uniref:8-oxo-dGTP diphosphatase n=1 Tax=Gilvimarinus xylanilyticus TaxID=2944139 RepID=A0A9X2I023_9GAMM|nr:Nudix family hydrolase [Gilvimarinus xylanilyticus]MCP8900234.1 Nudix family hydrolase [Gilvimarinus xylanilyticus]
MHKLIHVAVGAITDGSGNILLAKRPGHAHQGGLWEFPGGKVEPNETLLQALDRELFEELDIRVVSAEPVIEIIHDYGDKTVWLDVHWVTAFTGTPRGKEGQPLRWVPVNELPQYEFPAANYPIVNALTLPDKLLITGAFNSVDDFTGRLEAALQQGVKLVQLRAHEVNDTDYEQLAGLASERCNLYGARLVLNRHNAADFLNSIPAQGIHLSSAALEKAPVLPADIIVGASCHNQSQLQQAAKLGAHYATLSPVLPTKSHPDATPLRWNNFVHLAKKATLPVYALGGMNEEHLPPVKQKGGQGIAGISCWWGN